MARSGAHSRANDSRPLCCLSALACAPRGAKAGSAAAFCWCGPRRNGEGVARGGGGGTSCSWRTVVIHARAFVIAGRLVSESSYSKKRLAPLPPNPGLGVSLHEPSRTSLAAHFALPRAPLEHRRSRTSHRRMAFLNPDCIPTSRMRLVLLAYHQKKFLPFIPPALDASRGRKIICSPRLATLFRGEPVDSPRGCCRPCAAARGAG